MEKCHNCVYYKPSNKNYFVGECCIGTERRDYTEYDSHCNRWLTNKNKYNKELIGEDKC